MRQNLHHLFVRLAVMAGLVVLFVSATPAVSAINLFPDKYPDGTPAACSGAGADSAACSGNGKDTISGTDGIILRAAAIISIIASIAAVLVIMIAGIMFITAGGDSGKVTNAKNMITYAIVGLIVIFLARAIVAFVVSNV